MFRPVIVVMVGQHYSYVKGQDRSYTVKIQVFNLVRIPKNAIIWSISTKL